MNPELVERIKQCPSLPSLPTIAMQVLDLAQKSDVDIAEIARIISKDPALSTKILRTVNSSFYGRSQHVSTISHALVILGLQSVKTLVLGFSLVTNLKNNKGQGFKHLAYWKRSIYAATAARTIASKINLVQQEEAFLAALLKDIGMLVFDQVLGERYGEIYNKITTHNDLLALETEALGMTHAEAGKILADQWRLPPLLTTPIASHHAPSEVKDPVLRKLTELVSLSGHCADVFVDEGAAKAITSVRRLCSEFYKMPEAATDALLDEIGKRTKEVAGLFEINIGSSATFENILKKANEALIEMTLQSQMKASNLQVQNIELQKKATTDALTGLANRATFDDFAASSFATAKASPQPLAVLMIDVDKFKSVNDKFGHPAGDQVLRTLGKLVKTAARPQDLAARYGGEEMALILPGTNRATAAAIAESIRRAIAAKPVVAGTVTIPVTASIGVAVFEPGLPFQQIAQLIKAADLSLYAAKHGGRNCVKVFSMPRKAA